MKGIIPSVIIVLISGGLYFINSSKNNVCKTFMDYYTNRDQNKNCYYNPDGQLMVPEIVKRHGYASEEYQVTTEDGYILAVFRLYNKNLSKDKLKSPVFLQHGFAINSASFVNTGKKSLAFLLADAGYDVWLGNFRGSFYSREHVSYKASQSEYWDFTRDELGIYDTFAQIKFVHDTTKKKIIYIGFSMGTTTSMIYSTSYPKLAEDKLKIIIGLAPVFLMPSTKTASRVLLWFWPYLEPIVKYFTNGEMYVNGRPDSLLKKILCLPLPIQTFACQLTNMLVLGFDYEQNDPETLPITFLQNSDAASIKEFIHCRQTSVLEEFSKYDYGTEINKIKYGTPDPPNYNISNLRVPVYLVTAENDLVSVKSDAEFIYNRLPPKSKQYNIYVIENKKFNHLDFLLAKDVVKYLYNHLLKFIETL